MTSGMLSADNPDSYPIVVIHPGSLNLRFGLSTSICPMSIPHCIGRRQRTKRSSHYEDEWTPNPLKESSESKLLREIGLKAARESLSVRHISRAKRRKMVDPEQVLDFNQSSEVISESSPSSRPQRTAVGANAEFVVGQEAFLLDPQPAFDIHWPWKGGKLNAHSDIGGSITSIVQDLYDIWMSVLSSHLNINHSSTKFHRAVLLVPDSFKRSDVRELVDLLLNKIGFHSIFVTQESVCATFEEGLMCSCVIDIGDRKTSVCCIEDGMVKANTMMLLQMGGSDITGCFHWLLNKSGFPLKDINFSKRDDAMFVQELKELYCHLDQNVDGTKDVEILYRTPHMDFILKCLLRMGDERILAPMSLFFPEMLGLKVNEASVVLGGGKKVSDPSDVNDEEYLQQTMTKHELAARQRRKDQSELLSNQGQENGLGDDSQLNDFDGYDPLDLNTLRTNQIEDECDMWNLIGLHHSIMKSIERCETEEVKQKMYGNILLVGGGAMLQGTQNHLIYLLANQMKNSGKLYEMNVFPKEPSDLTHVAWKGACIMSCLDTSQELWITPRLWNKYGIRALRERIPFNW